MIGMLPALGRFSALRTMKAGDREMPFETTWGSISRVRVTGSEECATKCPLTLPKLAEVFTRLPPSRQFKYKQLSITRKALEA